jgi:hypothetical protein
MLAALRCYDVFVNLNGVRLFWKRLLDVDWVGERALL